MIIKKFKDIEEKEYSIFDHIKYLIDNNTDYKNFKFSFAAKYIFAFTKKDESILVIEENELLHYQFLLKNNFIKIVGGFKIYHINEELKNPFFNNNNQLEAIFYFDENDKDLSFKKCKYLINKTFNVASQLEHYPIIEYDGKYSVTIKISTNHNVTLKDEILANKITDIWNSIR